MSYFAKIDEDNIVLSVIVADQSFVDSQEGTYVECDFDGSSPKNYPGPGYSWSQSDNAFIAPKPYPSWTLDENFKWQAPVTRPEGTNYMWNEEEQSWDLV